MKVLNLTEGFNPLGISEKEEIKFSSFTFSGGEPHIKIDPKFIAEATEDAEIFITLRIKSFNDLGLLLIAKNAIDDLVYNAVCRLVIPYFPGGRQDRVAVPGEPLTVKVYADIINSMNFATVTVFDPHSDVTAAVVNNCVVENNHAFIKQIIHNDLCAGPGFVDIDKFNNLLLVSPDAGANKKIYSLAKELGVNRIIKCDKHRDVATGNLTGFQVYDDDLKGMPCIIVDDICDGGGTFIGLAEELKRKNAGDLYLIVTHGIFSKGLKELAKHFKKIYTTDSWRSEFSWEQEEREPTDICKIIKIEEIL